MTHNELADRCLRWLSYRITGRGMRGCREAALARQYIADAAALCSLQYRFWEDLCRHNGILERHIHWKLHEVLANYFLCVFEAKISRSDFAATFKGNGNRLSPIGNLHWCVITKGLVTADEVPPFWGILQTAGRGLCEIRQPHICLLPETDIDKIAHNLLWRRASAASAGDTMRYVRPPRIPEEARDADTD